MSTFGTALRVSTFGESHGCWIGCIVDGLPGGLNACTDCVQRQLQRRRPGAAAAAASSSRNEIDTAEIVSGVEGGLTLGSPVAIVIKNRDTRKQDYSNIGVNTERSAASDINASMRGIPRPGHAELTYLLKYKNTSSSGGGRSSARETAARVAAAALIESSLLSPFCLGRVVAFVSSVGPHSLPQQELDKYTQTPPDRTTVDRNGKVLFDHKQNLLKDALGCWHPGVGKTELALLLQQHEQATKTGSPGHGDPAGGPPGGPEGPPAATSEGTAGEKDDLWEIHTRCPHVQTAVQIARMLLQVRADGDSIGGSVCCVVANPPAGLGEPVFDRLPAVLAHAMLSIPATKGFELGSGFSAARMRGSEHNDPIHPREQRQTPPFSVLCTRERRPCNCQREAEKENQMEMQVNTQETRGDGDSRRRTVEACADAAVNLKCQTNHAGGTLGGISTGENIYFRVAFKPPSSISKVQVTSDFNGHLQQLQIKGRHDPCVVARAVPVVEAMAVLAVSDLIMQQASRVGFPFLRRDSCGIQGEEKDAF